MTRFLEDTYNCTAHLLMANKSKPSCQKDTMGLMASWFDSIFNHMPERDIYNLTGGLPHCVRDEISLDELPESRTWSTRGDPTLTMIFLFEDGSYQLTEEYIVYDSNDFIADVGGYLGLLLGHSVLSIYGYIPYW